MDKADTGLSIHSILVGSNPKDCLRWDVGQLVGKDKSLKITAIIHDDANFAIYGVKRYLIYVTKGGAEEDHLWRSYEGMPVSCLYDI